MKKNVFFYFVILILQSCGNPSGVGTSTSTTTGYNGPGSEWTSSVSNSVYTINMSDTGVSLSINATGTSLSTGHTKLTVNSATATGTTAPSVGDVAHAIEVPGVAFLFKPTSSTSETVAMVKSGSCPTADFEANWIIGGRDFNASTKSTATATDKDWSGDISWNTTSGQAIFSSQFSMETTTNLLSANQTQTLGTCANGLVQSADNSIKVYFTQAGVAIVTTNKGTTDESHIIAVPKATLSTIPSLYDDYAGFYFEDLATKATYAATATFTVGTGSNADLTISKVSGNDLTTTAAFSTVSFDTTTGLNSPANGFIRGRFATCTGGGDALGATDAKDDICEVTCAIAKNVNSSNKNFIYCIGQHPSDEDRRVTMLFVSK